MKKRQQTNHSKNPLLIILSGPSGVGKDATLAKMRESGYLFHYIVTVTTRPKRPGEIDRVDYRFISEEQFQKMVREKKLLEWAKVYGNFYGVPKEEIKKALQSGQDVIVKVDVQGAATIKNVVPEAVFIFLLPSSMQELTARLKQRNSHTSMKDLKLRLNKAEEEMASLPLFDYYVINHQNNIGLTVSQVMSIITAEKCRVNQRVITL